MDDFDDKDDDLRAIPGPGGLSVEAVCRQVKKISSRAFNRAASAASDAGFFDDLNLHPDLPVFANARAGLWHVDLTSPRVQLCRFKSTDGHAAATGNNFPLSRLNLVTARAAACSGGAVVVDATRKGKRFPDALSRTVPTWAAVVNRACRIWAGKEEEKDIFLVMPPWVPVSERSEIEGRVEGWARLLVSTGVDLSAFARELSQKPLVPVWVARKGGGGGGGGGPGKVEVIRASEGADGNEKTTTPLYLYSASDPTARRASVSCGCDSRSSSSSRKAENGKTAPPRNATHHACFAFSFDYEPGGGDDEEGWSRGLSARLFWKHRGQLLARGPEGFEEGADELAREEGAKRKKGRGGGGEGGVGAAGAPPRPPRWSPVCGTRLAVGDAAAAAAFLSSESEQGELSAASAAAAVVLFSSGEGNNDDDDDSSSSLSPSLCFRAAVSPKKKLGLLEALPSVVAFASAHLSKGKTVLFTSEEDDFDNAAAAAAAVLLACFSAPKPRAEFKRAFSCDSSPLPPLLPRPCGCPAPPRASRDEVRARVAAVCGSAAAGRSSEREGEENAFSSSSSSLPLSVGKEAAKQLLMFVSPPERPGGFRCPACRAGRPAKVGWERARGKEEKETGAAAVEVEA